MRKQKKAVKKAAPKKVQRGGKKSKAVVEQVLADYDANMSPEKICKKYNISARTLFRYQNRKNFTATTGTYRSKDEIASKDQVAPMPEAVRPEKKSWMEEQLDYAHAQMNKDLEKQFERYRPERNTSYPKIIITKCPTCNNIVKATTNVDGTNFYMPTTDNLLTLSNSPHSCPNCGSKMMGSLADTALGTHLGYTNYYKIPEKTITFPKTEPKFDPVNKPAHYADSKIEVIDYIEDKKMNYNLGNAVKYISRAGKKTPDPLQDLKKAQWYLNREISNLEKK